MNVDRAKLRRLRTEAFLTQLELSRKASVTEMTVSRLERGAGPARISTVKKLAAALGVHPAELLQAGNEANR